MAASYGCANVLHEHIRCTCFTENLEFVTKVEMITIHCKENHLLWNYTGNKYNAALKGRTEIVPLAVNLKNY